MSGTATTDLSGLKALAFDVFGTVVDWRSSVTDELRSLAATKLAASDGNGDGNDNTNTNTNTILRPEDREKLVAVDWAGFAQEWRDSYMAFTRGFVPGETEWKDIDAHHHDSLAALLEAHRLGSAFSRDEVRRLSLAWHRLRPWPDSAAGLRRLGGGGGGGAAADGKKFVTATLSNGNRALLRDLDDFGGLGFGRILSAEDWRAYKPSAAVYDGAVAALVGDGGGGGDPGEVAMVAAHLADLAAARGRGMRTVYVERPGEEAWEVGSPRYEDAKGWVDVWVKEGEGGFEEVARRLGA